MDEIDIAVLKTIRKECDRRRSGVSTGVLLKHCDMESLLKRLDSFERKEGLIHIGDFRLSHRKENPGTLLLASDITLTPSGEKFLQDQEE